MRWEVLRCEGVQNGKRKEIQFGGEGEVLIARSWAWSDSDGLEEDYQSTLGRRRVGTLVHGLDTTCFSVALRGLARGSEGLVNGTIVHLHAFSMISSVLLISSKPIRADEAGLASGLAVRTWA